MNTREQYVGALKVLGVYASETDIVIDGYDNLIDLNTTYDGYPHFLHVSGDGSLFYVQGYWLDDERDLYQEVDGERSESQQVEPEGLLYFLAARGCTYNSVKAQELGSTPPTLQLLNAWSASTNLSVNKHVEVLKQALADLLDNPTRAEAERQLAQFLGEQNDQT